MRKILLPVLLAVGIVAAIGAYALASANPQLPMTGQIELYGGPNGETCGSDANRIALDGSGTLSHVGAVDVHLVTTGGAPFRAVDLRHRAGDHRTHIQRP